VAEKKKRKGRRAYLDDFQAGVNGQYIYTGSMYRYEGAVPYQRAMRRVSLLTAAMCAALVCAGAVPAPSMLGFGNFYVIVPFLVEMVGVALAIWSAAKLIYGGEELRAYVHAATVKKLPDRLSMSLFFAGASIVANIVYLALKGFGGKVIASLLVIVFHALVILTAWLLKRELSTHRWTTGGEEDLSPSDPES